VFFLLINGSIVLQLQGPFQEHLSPLSLEYWPLEVVTPFLLASKPSSTCNLTRLWCRLMLKTFLIKFLELLF
jgi:hypothetical protein